MTQNEILVTLKKVINDNQQFTTWTVSTPHIMELVRICVEKEREECAKICEEFDDVSSDLDDLCVDYHAHLIRARSNNETQE